MALLFLRNPYWFLGSKVLVSAHLHNRVSNRDEIFWGKTLVRVK